MIPSTKKHIDLKRIWKEFQTKNPTVRIRDAAKQLGVSEGELVATGIGENACRLKSEFKEILHELHKLGRVMALTRNEQIVHERKGVYENANTDLPHKMALFVNSDIDLRIFLSGWHHAFAVTSESARGTMRSLQFFDRDGTAVHKIYLTENSDLVAYQKLVEKFSSENQKPEMATSKKTGKPADKPDEEIDIEGFRKAWAELKDTHDFFPLMKKFGVGRRQALRLAGENFSKEVPAESFKFVLETARDRRIPIMIFVGNPGIIQIHTGEVENVIEARGWFNVMDENFNLHINSPEIAAAYVVRKPTKDGTVTSLEIFNEKDEDIALFFGKRKPGIPEREDWRKLIADLEKAV